MGNNIVLKLVKKGCVVSPTAIPYLCSFFHTLKEMHTLSKVVLISLIIEFN